MRYPPHRVLVLAADDWNDPDFLREQFTRLASLHRKILVIYPDDTYPWQIYVHDWCAQHSGKFLDYGFQRDVFKYKKPSDATTERDWRMFWDGDPHEVWKIESSKGCKGRPNFPVYAHLWQAALKSNMTCVAFRAPYRKSKPRNKDYMVPAVSVRKKRLPPKTA